MSDAIRESKSTLRERRARLGLTQASIAAKIGVSVGWYALVEREPAHLSRRLAEKAAALMGCAPDDLLPNGGCRP